MLSRIGAETKQIRLGAGAVLLPYYKPLFVAETYHVLETLYPGRIDIGLGRAPGGSAEVSMALSDNYLKKVREFETDVETLLNFIHQKFADSQAFSKIKPMPVPVQAPQVWSLGTSEKSAELAAKLGLAYCFGDFMTDSNGPKAMHTYRHHFKERNNQTAQSIVAINFVCAETSAEAEKLALSQIIWKLKQEKYLTEEKLPSVKQAE